MLPEYILYGLIVALASYGLGNLNGAILVSRGLGGDVRKKGSGNAGLTNFYRCYGKMHLAQVLAIDMLKAVVSVLVGWFAFHGLGRETLGMELALLFVVVGHMFPVAFDFRGGKGILSAAGALLVIDWRLFLLLVGLFAVIVLLTRLVSLGSVIAAALLPLGTWFLGGQDVAVTVCAAVVAALMLWMHRGNIGRLLRNEERKLAFIH